MMKRWVVLCLLVATAVPACAADLVQLLPAAGMTITLYPGQTRALVRETRTVSLPAGDSLLSFSWAAANLDGSSPTLTVPGAVVGDAVRTAGQDKALAWRVNSPQPVQGEAVVSYFLDGFKWYPSYRLWLQEDGASARLVGSLHLTNDTGVDLPSARVEVVTAGPGLIDQVGGEATAATAPQATSAAHTVSATGPLTAGETCVRELLQVDKVPAAVHYLYQADRFNGGVERMLVLSLPAGLAGLPDGQMTIQAAADGGLPLFTTPLSYQPGQELKVDLGPEPDVVVERKLMGCARSNFETDRFGRFTGSDTTEDYTLCLRNRLGSAVTLEFTETVLSTWELKSALTPVKTDSSTKQFDVPLPPDQPVELAFTLVKHSGTRAKK